MEKCILVIDDADQSVNKKSLEIRVKSYCNLEVLLVKTTDKEYRVADSDHLDLRKLKDAIGEKIKGRHISWVFTDFNLAEESINGLSVVKILKELRKSIKVVMYSGNLDDVVRSVVGGNISSANVDDIVKDFVNKAVELINRDDDPTVQDYFIQQLRKYSDMEFQSCYPKLSGKKLGEIADMIENSSDKRTDAWTQELVEQAIAYLVKINS